MSANGNSNTTTGGSGGIVRAVPDVIDFEFTDTVAPNETVRGNDWSNIVGDQTTDTNECVEVVKLELLPPVDEDPAGDGTAPPAMQNWRYLRLWDGDSYYPHVRYKPWMMGWQGPNHHLSTPPLGEPVLSGDNNPSGNPISSATPKFGPSRSVTPAIVNDDTAIDQPFTVRMHVWRFKGSEREFQNYISQQYGTTSFSQSLSMSNPYTGTSRTYSRARATSLSSGNDPLAAFAKLTGGIDQLQPKVFPWVTWSTNANPTRANTPYEFTTRNGRVDEDWQRLEFDFTDQRRAAIFDSLVVQQVANLQEGSIVVEERDSDPSIILSDDDRHQLPATIDEEGAENGIYDSGELPKSLQDMFGRKPVLWDDGGGFRITDNGTSIAAGDLRVGVMGRYLELTS